ncbi:PREDICTED: DNA-directed RNA polymerase I subunit RPA49-like [Dufourea novaeangliae]|uniref:DNA-directed RNA polymerase I subunit RPA49-like n=1 Tax=Dufourea novaeangliae TaxID=178035 RepID=UPI0007670D75|nr:PREDICTED: DNA-directed RNA polymerase I subunit RPA49-like [Dufourea novaeangliae]
MKQRIEAIIEDVIVEPDKIQPIIVNFQNGELKDEEAKKMSCNLFYDQQKNKTMLALSNGQIVYRGYRPDTSQDLMRTMLVFHNRKTGKVRLVQAERWQVAPILDKPTEENNKITTDERIAILNKQFGSKRVKRRTEQFEKMKVNVDSIKEQLEQTVSNVEIDRMDLSTQLPDNDYITNTALPECNRDATNVKDVYNVYDIIPQNMLETLYDKATEILNKDSSSLEGKTKFFSRTLKFIKTDPDNVKKTALLHYMQAVATWLNMPIKDAKKRGIEVCPTSQEVNSYIIETYSVQSSHGRMRPNSVKDKGVIHCMILALVICNFTLDVEIFSTIFNHRMGLKKLKSLARVIGALSGKDDKNIVTLKVPLPPAAPLIKKGKKK